MRIAVLYNPNNMRHANRLINGLMACNRNVSPIPEIEDLNPDNYEYVFIESASPKAHNCLDGKKNVFLYDMEDDPDQPVAGPVYDQLKDSALAYVKYNFTTEKTGNLKNIASPLVEYIHKGKELAQAVHKLPRDRKGLDVFFLGGPSYYSLGYTPKEGSNHIVTEDLNTIPLNIRDPKRADQHVYHQRLEWIAMIKANKELRFQGGLWFDNNPESNINIDFQKKQFGPKVSDYIYNQLSNDHLYTNLFSSEWGLCPSGFARSSFRLIELMALGKPILLTESQDYRYLYNPKHFIEVPDGTKIDELMLQEDVQYFQHLSRARENHEIFYNLTQSQMWDDFIRQIQ